MRRMCVTYTHLLKIAPTNMTTDDCSDILYDSQRALKALQYLIDTPYFPHRVRALRNAVVKPRRMPFKDDAEVLNELLVIGRQSLQSLENLIAVAERKRGTRNDYQREFMATKRRRERMAVRCEENRLSRKLTPNERYQYLAAITAKWNEERDMKVSKWAKKFSSSTGREPTNLEKFEYIKTYWDNVESQMESSLFNPTNRKT